MSSVYPRNSFQVSSGLAPMQIVSVLKFAVDHGCDEYLRPGIGALNDHGVHLFAPNLRNLVIPIGLQRKLEHLPRRGALLFDRVIACWFHVMGAGEAHGARLTVH